MDEWSVTFGELEAALAALHHIAQSKRTAFQARLKNFHRLGFPEGLKAEKGRASKYTAHQAFEMSLAVELTQLGLPPERATTVVMSNHYEVSTAVLMAGRGLLSARESESQPDQIYIYFDPTALSAMSESDVPVDVTSFFHAGQAGLAEMLKLFEPNESPRLSLVNLTNELESLDRRLSSGFLEALVSRSGQFEQPGYGTVERAVLDLKEARKHGVKSESYRQALIGLVEATGGNPKA